MLVVCLPYYSGDFPLALANLQLIVDLGGVTDFHCILVTDQTTTHVQRSEIQQLAANGFKSVEALLLDNVPSMWPQGPNQMLERTAYHMATAYPQEPFLFLEPDVTVTRPTWLREIAAAYGAHGMPFMGAVRPTYGADNRGQRIVTGRHMVGMGVYPPSFYFQSNIIRALHVSPTLYNPVTKVNIAKGFDILLGDEILLAGCYNSELFSHSWRTSNYRDENGHIVCDRAEPNANFDEPNIRIPALCHGVKDTSLIALVRAKMDASYVDTPIERKFQAVGRFDPATGFTSDGKLHDAVYREPVATVPINQGISQQEWAEFQAFKAQRNQVVGTMAFASAPPVVSLLSPLPVYTDTQREQARAALEHHHAMQGLMAQAPQAVPSHEPTTQAELVRARMAQGGFGDEDEPYGVAMAPEALTQPIAPPPIQVVDVPIAREAEASVASGSEVMSNERTDALGTAPIGNDTFSADVSQGEPYTIQIKEAAIKADIRSGMAHKLLLQTHGINAVTAKKYREEVKAEDLVPA